MTKVADDVPFSNDVVPRTVQAYETRRAQGTDRVSDEDLAVSDNWIRPCAVRAASGHSMSSSPDKMHMRVGPDKFAIHPSSMCWSIPSKSPSTVLVQLVTICHPSLKTASCRNGSLGQLFREIVQPFWLFCSMGQPQQDHDVQGARE